MYRSKVLCPFSWSAVYTGGYVRPYWRYGERGQVLLKFCELINGNGKYLGVWTATQMSRQAKSMILNWIWYLANANIEYDNVDFSWGGDLPIE